MLSQLTYPYQLPKLNYPYDGLEKAIDTQTMEIHHTKHHQAYIDKLNAALQDFLEYQKLNLEELLRTIETLPTELKTPVINHGGGHANHTLFWNTMAPSSTNVSPQGGLLDCVSETFGSLDQFKTLFSEKAAALFGSGWTWLVFNRSDSKILITTTANQNSPLLDNQHPLLGIDLWEHAYYLRYQNRRADYIKNWWQIVDWEQISQVYTGLANR